MNRRGFCLAGSAAFVAAQLFGSATRPLANSSALGETSVPGSEDTLAGPPHGPWRRLFLDAAVIERSEGLSRVFHAAQKHSGDPIIQRDRPWEGVAAITGPYVYGSVLWDGGKLHMWYQVLTRGNHVGYAESHDGVHWTKPELGIIEFDGSKANNLVVSAYQPAVAGGGHCHNPSVILRPEEADVQKRFALYGFDNQCGHPRVAFSPDGLHWQYVPETATQPLFSSSDVVNFFYDPYQARYACTWKTRNRRGRAVGIAWSADGLDWTKPFDGPIFVADDLDLDATQIYGMPVFPYQGLYIGQPWIYSARYFRFGEYSVERLHEAQADSPRTIDVQLAWSWDLINWTRPPERHSFIPRGGPGTWDSGMIVTARAPVVVGDQLYFYYGGCDGVHDQPRVRAAIGLATLRLDGFCSMQADESEGWLITRREPFYEPAVTINARTASNGLVTAEILDRHNHVVLGFGREDCRAFAGDSVRHVLTWKTGQFPLQQALTDYKIRFWLKSAELFSYLPHGLDHSQRDLARFPNSGP
ncbi:MAG: hypothetical protein HY000_33290 [Planctomycetes bacterium]|nr:hypothetical protein [Planctomycetota bacterium]